MSAAAWAFIFFQKKTKQKKQHPANSRTQNSLNQQFMLVVFSKENFDCVQTVLADIMNNIYLFLIGCQYFFYSKKSIKLDCLANPKVFT
ncbi:hypothetical protein EGI22_14200 [Lacihabitans sp. LS3-19]|nr:hypothetical protein [Lacihabitans sp. LS3-19]